MVAQQPFLSTSLASTSLKMIHMDSLCTCECFWSYSHWLIMIKPFFSQELGMILRDQWLTAGGTPCVFFLFFLIRATNTNYFYKKSPHLNRKRLEFWNCNKLQMSLRELECHEGSASLHYMCWPSAEDFFCTQSDALWYFDSLAYHQQVWNENYINIYANIVRLYHDDKDHSGCMLLFYRQTSYV